MKFVAYLKKRVVAWVNEPFYRDELRKAYNAGYSQGRLDTLCGLTRNDDDGEL